MSSSVVKSIPNILNRNCIRDDIDIDYGYDIGYLDRNINRIKNHLIKEGVKKGDLITISILKVDVDHICSLIACAELGLVLILLDCPATIYSLPYTKLALHGPSDYYICRNDGHRRAYDGLHGKMLDMYGGKRISINDMDLSKSIDTQPWEVFDDDPLLLSSTSGTTKSSRPVYFSHREVMSISKRNVKVFEFEEDSKVLHSRNLHHASAMLTSLIPSLMTSKTHMTFNITQEAPEKQAIVNLEKVYENEFTHVMIANKKSLNSFLCGFTKPFKRTLNINMCGFALDTSFVDLAQEHNVKFQSHYGSIDTAIPFLINFVDKNSIVEENSLGIMPDQFYGMVMKDNRVELFSDLWDEPRYLEDELEFRDGQFFLINPRKIELPDIDLTPFMHDTKIAMEQLRGHLHETGYYSKRHSD